MRTNTANFSREPVTVDGVEEARSKPGAHQPYVYPTSPISRDYPATKMSVASSNASISTPTVPEKPKHRRVPFACQLDCCGYRLLSR